MSPEDRADFDDWWTGRITWDELKARYWERPPEPYEVKAARMMALLAKTKAEAVRLEKMLAAFKAYEARRGDPAPGGGMGQSRRCH